ncbi:MAG TPA: sugar phosphate isomerase/epimerase family protein [Chloroflexota bacterium]|nr:sugar phosphate isomerase/epimerase family protein [Chloroflexota bacterium]
MPFKGLALHTWTLDSTPLSQVLQVARRTGWQAVELRRVDFIRAFEAGRSAEDVLELVQGSGLPVACVGVQYGWMFAKAEERRQLLEAFADSCRWAAALNCQTVMSPVDRGQGDFRRAVASVREVGDLAAEHGVRLALEFNSQSEQINTLDRVREVLSAARHPQCGLLLDAYHLQRSGGLDSATDVRSEEIVYVQYSDVPSGVLERGVVLNRLPPGRGIVPFREFFGLLDDKRYEGYLSYEAPNPAAWERDPEEVAREALAATRSLLPS